MEMAENGKRLLSVSQVSRYLKMLLQSDPVLQNICISGEISNYKFHQPSGHTYFTLKDEGSILRCVFFRGKSAGLNFQPGEGMRVLAYGSISLYERGGYYQLYVDAMEPEGLGTLYLAYEQLKEKLRSEGLFEQRFKKPIPFFPRKIGLITSPSGAAVRDFLSTIARRFPCTNVVLAPAAVQGDEAAPGIIAALTKLDASAEFDLIVITRGGGSLEDLWPFNDEKLARAIFGAKTPVISAVGHETDFTIADFVADVRAATPTAAAEIAVPELQQLLGDVEYKNEYLQRLWKQDCFRRRANLERCSAAALLRLPRDKINQGKQSLDEIERLAGHLINTQTKSYVSRLDHLKERLEALHPLKVMERGFVFVLDKEKKLVGSINQLEVNQEIDLFFKNGEAGCSVSSLREKLPGKPASSGKEV